MAFFNFRTLGDQRAHVDNSIAWSHLPDGSELEMQHGPNAQAPRLVPRGLMIALGLKSIT